MIKKLMLVLFVVLLFVLAGCDENREVKVTIKGHEVKTAIVDGKQTERYYIFVEGEDLNAKVEVFPRTGLFVFSSFEEQFPLEMIIVVKEKELINIQGGVK